MNSPHPPRCIFTVARFTYSKYWLASELAGPNSFVCSEVLSTLLLSARQTNPLGFNFDRGKA